MLELHNNRTVTKYLLLIRKPEGQQLNRYSDKESLAFMTILPLALCFTET